MPTLVVNDNSWGEGIGALLGGMSAGNDPQKRMQAALAQARIDAQSLAARQTQIENEKLILQRQAEDRAIAAVGGELTPEKFHRFVPEFVEQPRPTSDFVGPMPVTAPNPDRATLPSRLAAARAIAENALRRGGTSEQALRGAYGGLGYGQLYAAGIPKDENEARRLTGLVEGKIPSANVPMTEQQRRVMENEERAKATALEAQRQGGAMERERLQQETALVRAREEEAGRMTRFQQGDLSVGQNATVYMSPERRRSLGLPAEGPIQGQVSVGPKETVIRPGGETLRGAELPDPNAPPSASTDPSFRRNGLRRGRSQQGAGDPRTGRESPGLADTRTPARILGRLQKSLRGPEVAGRRGRRSDPTRRQDQTNVPAAGRRRAAGLHEPRPACGPLRSTSAAAGAFRRAFKCSSGRPRWRSDLHYATGLGLDPEHRLVGATGSGTGFYSTRWPG